MQRKQLELETKKIGFDALRISNTDMLPREIQKNLNFETHTVRYLTRNGEKVEGLTHSEIEKAKKLGYKYYDDSNGFFAVAEFEQ